MMIATLGITRSQVSASAGSQFLLFAASTIVILHRLCRSVEVESNVNR